MPVDSIALAWHMPRVIIFLAIIEHGSISAAARSLNLSKSVVSTHLRQLEEACNARLIERTTRHLRLTDAGNRFLLHAQRMANAWSDGLEEVAATMVEPAGTLTVTTVTVMENSLLAPAVAAFVNRYPRVMVDVWSTDVIVDLLVENVDLAIRTGPLPDSSFYARKLGEDADVIVASPQILSRFHDPQRPEQLQSLPWVTHRRMPVRRELHGPNEERFELEVAPRARVNSAPELLNLALLSTGVALLPGLLARDALQSGQLVRVLSDWHGPTFGIYAVFPSKRHLAPKVERFVEELQRQFT